LDAVANQIQRATARAATRRQSSPARVLITLVVVVVASVVLAVVADIDNVSQVLRMLLSS
jgi:hypothetical protein